MELCIGCKLCTHRCVWVGTINTSFTEEQLSRNLRGANIKTTYLSIGSVKPTILKPFCQNMYQLKYLNADFPCFNSVLNFLSNCFNPESNIQVKDIRSLKRGPQLLHRYKNLQNCGEFENTVQEKRKIRYIMQRMEMPISIAVNRCVTLLRNVV